MPTSRRLAWSSTDPCSSAAAGIVDEPESLGAIARALTALATDPSRRPHWD